MSLLICPDCDRACHGLNLPHAPHYATLPCGHPGVVNCHNKAVEVCSTCGRDDRPSKEPRHTFVSAKSS